MADTDVAFSGPVHQAELVRAGEVSPRELVTLYLNRIAELDSKLNSFRVVRAERALAEAEKAERIRASGEDRPLLGVPIAVKDIMDVAGEVTTLGTGSVDEPAREDSEVVRRLRAAGAIVIGKTNLPELAFAMFTESPTWGITRNPWDLTRVPGGSSGGSAAAVAAGLAAAATASDGAGSIRIPAAYCSLFGLKAQRGRVPMDPLVEHWYGLSVNGHLTRSVMDTATLLDVTAGGGLAPRKPGAPKRPFAESASTVPERLRICVSPRAARALAPPMLDDRCRGALEGTAELLASLGHEVAWRDPEYRGLGNHFSALYMRGIADDARGLPHPERLGNHMRQVARLGGLYTGAVVRRAQAATAKHAARVNAIFDHCDVLLTPTIGEPPVPVGRWDGTGGLRTVVGMSRRAGYTPPWNYLGNPAAAVPAGFTPEGLPLSVQLVGRPDDEATLLSLAAQIESERPWADRRPPVS
jgi:amidase